MDWPHNVSVQASKAVLNFYKLDCLHHPLAAFFNYLYKADQGLPQSSSWCGTSPRVKGLILVRVRYLSGSNTCPGAVLVWARYLYGRGTCMGARLVRARARYLSRCGTCPGAVLVQAQYLSRRGTCPGAAIIHMT